MTAVALLAAAVCAALVPALQAQAGAAVTGEPIVFGNTTCAPNWPVPQPGANRFVIHNESDHRATVYLFRSDTGNILATVSGLRAGATHVLNARLIPRKHYAWACDLDGYPVHDSEADLVPIQRQAGGNGPAVVPVVASELIPSLRTYRRYVGRKLTALLTQVATLRQAISAGDLAGAQADWLSAHLTWLEVGQDDGAYGAFGDLGRSIDGTAAGLPGATASPDFTGFHRVELDLWGASGLAGAASDAATLARLVRRLSRTSLQTVLPTSDSGLSGWTLRAHEILEDALRDTLTGDDDYGSHSALASLGADVAATREMLTLLAVPLAPRAPYLVATARRELTALSAAITAAVASVGGSPVALTALPAADRERIDADTGVAAETLSRVPGLLQVGTS